MCAALQAPYCAKINGASDKASLCQQQEAQDSCRRSCDLCYPKTDSSSLVWYNQHRHSLTNTPYPTSAHNQTHGSFEGVIGGSKHAHSSACTSHESQLDVLPNATTHGTYINTVGQLNSGCQVFTVAAAPGSKLAQDRNVSMLAELGSQDSWSTHFSNPFCNSVLFLCALLLGLTVWLARGKVRRKRSLQRLHA